MQSVSGPWMSWLLVQKPPTLSLLGASCPEESCTRECWAAIRSLQMEAWLPVNVIVVPLFIVDVVVLFVLLLGSMWSVALPEKRIWPPPGRQSWQYISAWTCFYLAFASNAALFILDWNSWILTDVTRLILGIPLGVIGAASTRPRIVNRYENWEPNDD